MAGSSPNLVENIMEKMFYQAILNGSTFCVSRLLSLGADPNSAREVLPPLHACVKFHQLRIAKALINAGTDVNSRDNTGRTPLHLAIETEHLELFNLIVSCGGDINATDHSGLTPLHVAVETAKDLIFMKYLLEHGAFVDAATQDGITPLHNAVITNSPEKVKILLEFRPNVDMKEYQNVFDVAMDRSCASIVDELLIYGFSANEEQVRDTRFLCRAVASNQSSLVRHLLRKGADPNSKYQGSTPLNLACSYGHYKTFKLLLQHGADSKNSIVAIDSAVMYNHSKIVVKLLDNGALKRPALFFHALMHNSIDVFESLLKYNIPRFNVNSTFGDTTLAHVAVDGDNLKAVELLWRFGADFDIFKRGYTPLHNACRTNTPRVIEAILKLGSDVNLQDVDRETPADILCREDGKTAEVIRKHIMTLYAADMFVSDQNLAFLWEDCDEALLSEMQAEVQIMKTTKVKNTDVSFYKLLKCSEAEMATYANNRHIYALLKSEYYKHKFKHFFYLLNTKFVIGFRRKTFIDIFKESVVAKTDFLTQIPEICLHQILSLISTEDIGIMAGQIQRRMTISDRVIYYRKLNYSLNLNTIYVN